MRRFCDERISKGSWRDTICRRNAKNVTSYWALEAQGKPTLPEICTGSSRKVGKRYFSARFFFPLFFSGRGETDTVVWG